MARDQLIERTNNVKVREKLLMESGTVSLANIVELACQVEIAVEEARQMMSDREMTDKPQSASVSPAAVQEVAARWGKVGSISESRWSGNEKRSDRSGQRCKSSTTVVSLIIQDMSCQRQRVPGLW